jgi:transposase
VRLRWRTGLGRRTPADGDGAAARDRKPTSEGRGRTRDGRISAYAADDQPCGGTGPPAVAYVYAPDRKGIRPARHLPAFRGTLQVDGYGGFRALTERRNDGAVALAFCWAHLRRRFHKVHAHTISPIAAEALLRISALYTVEREIRGWPAEARQMARQQRSALLVQDLHLWLDAQLNRVSQGSALAAAIRYGLRHWEGLRRFLDDGTLELDTNSVERDPPHLRHPQGRAVRRQRGGRRELGHCRHTHPHRHPERGQPADLAQRRVGEMVHGEVRSTALTTLLSWAWCEPATAAA